MANIHDSGYEFTADTDIIQKLDDNPNETDMTASELKVAFDTGSGNVVKAINAEGGLVDAINTRCDEIETETSTITGDLANLDTTTKTNLVSAINEVNDKLDDSGWINLTTAKGTWSYFRCRKIGKIVEIQGRASAYAWGGSAENIVTLPEGFRPSESIYEYGFTSGIRLDRWYINTNGTMGVDYSVNISNGSTYTTSNWHSIFVTYMVD